jgi:thiol-disulfide isomerase/thioredoxin
MNQRIPRSFCLKNASFIPMKCPTLALQTLPLNLLCWVLLGFFGDSPARGQAVRIDWQQDLPQAFLDARAEDKLVLIHFTASWSKKSKELQTFVFKNPRVARAIQHNVIPVWIDIDQYPQLGQEYGVEEVPYDLVLTAGRRIVLRRPSPASSDHYASMIEKLDRTIHQIKDQGLASVEKNVDGPSLMVSTQQTIGPQTDFTPPAPTQRPAAPSSHSAELLRTSQGASKNSLKPIHSPLKPLAFVPDHAERQLATTQPEIRLDHQAHPATPNRGLRIFNAKFFAEQGKELEEQPMAQALLVVDHQLPTDSLISLISAATPATGQPTSDLLNQPETSDSGNAPQMLQTSQAEEIAPDEFQAECQSEAQAQSPGEFQDKSLNKSKSDFQADWQTDCKTEPPAATEAPQPTPPQVALQGHCPVTLIRERRWVKGDPESSCLHRERLFYFRGPAELAEFQQGPDTFSPLMSGCDPVMYDQTGEWVEGREEHGAFLGNPPHFRVVLFASRETRERFAADPRKYIEVIRQAMEPNRSGGK